MDLREFAIDVHLADGTRYQVTVRSSSSNPAVGARTIFTNSDGWHSTVRVIDMAVHHGMKLDGNARQTLDRFRGSISTDGQNSTFVAVGLTRNDVIELHDAAQDYLDDQVVTEGWSFGWVRRPDVMYFVLANEVWWAQNVDSPADQTVSHSEPESSERTLYEFTDMGAILYDGKPNFLTGCDCQITNRRVILRCGRGGVHQIPLRDVANIVPKIGWTEKAIEVEVGGTKVYKMMLKGKDQALMMYHALSQAIAG